MAGDEPLGQGSRTQEKPDAGQGSRWAGKKTDCADNAIKVLALFGSDAAHAV